MSRADVERVWFITGANSGFGRRLVDCVLARGDKVIVAARTTETANSLALPSESSHLRIVQLDVTEPFESIQLKVEDAIRLFGRIDVLVNNAGLVAPALLEEGGMEAATHHFDVNYFGVVKVTNAVLPHMRQRSSGTVVIIGSRSAWKADVPGVGHYAATKAAVHGKSGIIIGPRRLTALLAFGETLAVEIAPFSIRVLVVQPGLFRTEGIHSRALISVRPDPAYDEARKLVQERLTTLGQRVTDIGDPRKAMEVVVDVVRGEGQAQGKDWPLKLVLGEDAEKDVRATCLRTMTGLEEWSEASRSTKKDE